VAQSLDDELADQHRGAGLVGAAGLRAAARTRAWSAPGPRRS
jgi:hypothetical protein